MVITSLLVEADHGNIGADTLSTENWIDANKTYQISDKSTKQGRRGTHDQSVVIGGDKAQKPQVRLISHHNLSSFYLPTYF